jgi:hypothetical protein
MTIAESRAGTGSGPMVVAAHRGGVEVIERWADRWHSLCTQSTDDQPLFRPEWIAAHIRAFTPRPRVDRKPVADFLRPGKQSGLSMK